MKYISKLIRIIGGASLEIYIIQGVFFSFVISGKTDNYPAWHDTMTIGMIIVSTALGIMSHWLINKLLFQRFLR